MNQKWAKIIKLDKILVGKKYPTFIIAEAGVNHNGNVLLAKKLIDASVDAGANAVKFQTYVTEKLVSNKLLPRMFKMLKKYELAPHIFGELKDYSKSNNIIFCSTPFDFSSVDLLENIGVQFYKIGSGDIDNLPLLTHVAKKKKPILLSSGMSSNKEISEALSSMYRFNNKITLLHCTSIYPAKIGDANLNLIQRLGEKYDILTGYSDHTLGIEASLAAVCLGACIIEKHITLDNKMKGPDHKTSLNPNDFKKMITSIRDIESSFGLRNKVILSGEKKVRKIARHSIISSQNISKGKIIQKNDVDILRPSGGIKPKHFNELIGKKTKTSIPKGIMIKWSMLE